ncbi:hypothetical protein AAEX28_13030 [Lentisphaerota bacterium WC36G]|nr:hypothetical protein LJT99_15855 [Lentisphaerae bacterium WC36]
MQYMSLQDPSQIREVSAKKVTANFRLFILQEFLFKLFLAGGHFFCACAILGGLMLFILCELLLANYVQLVVAKSKDLINIDLTLLYIFLPILIINTLFMFTQIAKNVPINIFSSFTIESIFYKKNLASAKELKGKSKIMCVLIGFLSFFFATPGKLFADSLGIFYQAFKILFTMSQYSKLIVTLTQANSPLDEDFIISMADLNHATGLKKILNLTKGGWLIKTRNGYKLTTIYREKFDKEHSRETT